MALGKEFWNIIDIISVVFLIISIFMNKRIELKL
ncbi:hypothetical protein [Tenacibaculum aiptasiae]